MTLGPQPIKRDAFLYMEGKGDKQCGTCWLFYEDAKRCAVLPSDLVVNAEDSCGYWGPDTGYVVPIERAPKFTPEEVGFVRREVRCENCFHFDKSENVCYLFDRLNHLRADGALLFSLDTKVAPEGCCNAQTPRRSRVVT